MSAPLPPRPQPARTTILAASAVASMPPGSAMLLFSSGNLETET